MLLVATYRLKTETGTHFHKKKPVLLLIGTDLELLIGNFSVTCNS